jgi:hypothetical protein
VPLSWRTTTLASAVHVSLLLLANRQPLPVEGLGHVVEPPFSDPLELDAQRNYPGWPLPRPKSPLQGFQQRVHVGGWQPLSRRGFNHLPGSDHL